MLDAFLTGGVLNTRADAPLADSLKVGRPVYRLRAVVVHYGSHSFGHFLCYRRGPSASEPLRDRWYRVSDEETSLVSLAEVLESNPTLLFYDQTHPESAAPARPVVPLELTSLQAWALNAPRSIASRPDPKTSAPRF